MLNNLDCLIFVYLLFLLVLLIENTQWHSIFVKKMTKIAENKNKTAQPIYAQS